MPSRLHNGETFPDLTVDVVDRDGRILTAVYSSGAIGRWAPDDIVDFVRYIEAHRDARLPTAVAAR
jgi:hypothetical protein